jgi:fructose-1,6-bisphosphatase
MLKAPGTRRLKLKCHELLSSSALNFNLRRCTEDQALRPGREQVAAGYANYSSATSFVVAVAGAYTRFHFSSS